MEHRNLDFEARVRLRRYASPQKIIEEMVAEGMDEAGSRQAMERLLIRRRDRKRGGVGMMIGGVAMAVAGLFIGTGIGLVLIIAGLSLAGKGGSDAFSF